MMKPKLLYHGTVFAGFLAIAGLATASADNENTISEKWTPADIGKESQAQIHREVGKPFLALYKVVHILEFYFLDLNFYGIEFLNGNV